MKSIPWAQITDSSQAGHRVIDGGALPDAGRLWAVRGCVLLHRLHCVVNFRLLLRAARV